MVVRLHHYDQKEIDRLQKHWIFVYPQEARIIFGIHGPAMERVFKEYQYNASHLTNLVIERKDRGRFYVTPPIGPASELYNGLVYDFHTCTLDRPFLSGRDKVNKEAQKEWITALKVLEPRVLSMVRLAGLDPIREMATVGIEPYSWTTTCVLIDALRSGAPTAQLVELVQYMIRVQTLWGFARTLEVDQIRKAFGWLITTHKYEIRKAFNVWGTQ
jgi:hypothetical protein